MKKLRPLSLGWILFNSLVLTTFIASIVVLILARTQINIIIVIFGNIVLLCVIINRLIYLLRIYITISNEYLFIPNSFENAKWRVQFEEKIYFKDIVNVEIVATSKNSQDKHIISPTAYGYTIKKYLEITLKNGDKKRVWINYYSKRQIHNLLAHIQKHCEQPVDVEKVMQKWYSTFYGYKKIFIKGNKKSNF